MIITITISTANAAFEDDAELPRIFRKIAAEYVNDGGNIHTGPILDVNGNTVGHVSTDQVPADICPKCQVAGSGPIIYKGSADACCSVCGTDWPEVVTK